MEANSKAGIGRALFEAYLSRPAHVVVAAVRDPSSPASQALKGLPHGAGSRSLLVKIDSSSQSDALTAVEFLRSQHGIKRLDLVVANAGVSKYFGKAEETLVQEMLDHFTVNTVGPLLLFQATCSLLSESPRPKFVTISSGAGSIGMVEQLKVENTAYGASKAALNFVTRRIHYENPNIIAFCINPGWLQTDVSVSRHDCAWLQY